MQIRLATPQDADAIWGLLQPVFAAAETYAIDPAVSRADALAYWMGQAACYVAEAEGRILGTYYIKTNQQGGGSHICNCGYIVGPEARGRGVAAAMCTASQDQARDLGYLAMQFNLVLASNTGAVRLWQRLGFDIIGTIPQAFDHPQAGMVDAYVMHKPL